MTGCWRVVVLLFVFAASSWSAPASAQSLGSFSWQLAPYCNVVTVSVTQDGSVYTLDGYDNQCGAPERGAASGTAFINPTGTVGLGLTTVTSPGGVAVHLEAVLDIVSLGGTWRDSHGNSGALIFSPASASGSPRPLGTGDIPDGAITNAKLADGAVTAAKIDPVEVQRRIAGVCPAGQLMTAVNTDGTVSCEAPVSTGTGDISEVTAGTGLLGGGSSGSVQLRVSFGGTGMASNVARSDHAHGTAIGAGANTSVGSGALDTATPGTNNTAVGTDVLGVNLAAGNGNTGVGAMALRDQQTGTQNTAVGSFALSENTLGTMNTAIGREALASLNGAVSNQSSRNTAVGKHALADLIEGYTNIALGAFAGDILTSGNFNIYIGSGGGLTEDRTIRIGQDQDRAFIDGIRGVATGVNDAVPVVVDSSGQLGTVSSSRQTKFDIADLAPPVTEALHRLHPVQFRYRRVFADGSTPIQYGLIAEEVDEVLPGLVAYGADGTPETVKYHVLPALLLADVQRLERERQRLATALERETTRVAGLEERLDAQARAIEALRLELARENGRR